MRYCGLDLGKKYSHFCIVDEQRKVQSEARIRNRRDDYQEHFGDCEPMKFVLEASGKAFWVADQLKAIGHTVIVVDPGRTKAIGAARIKHDRLDARILAELCQADLLAAVSQPNVELRLRRMAVAARSGLVRARARLVMLVRSLADSEGIDLPRCATTKFVALVRGVADSLPTPMRSAFEPILSSIDQIGQGIADCDAQLLEWSKQDETIKLLQTAPGVGPITAAVFACAIRDPRRFDSGRHVAAYLGLVPSLYASGNTFRRGRITKHGNAHARWALTMAANALLRTRRTSSIGRWGRALALRIGRKKAVVAVARKLAAVLWSMWRNGRAFETRLPEAAPASASASAAA